MTAEERVAAAIDTVPELRGARGFERLGGVTNDNFKVQSPAGEFVVRVACTDADLLDIEAATGLANCRQASALGIGTPFVAWLPSERVVVMRFLEGRTLMPEGHARRAAADRLRLLGAERSLFGPRRRVV